MARPRGTHEPTVYELIMGDLEMLQEDVKKLIKDKEIYKSGVICPKCKCDSNATIDTRLESDGFRFRKRECKRCGKRWKTIEIIY